MSDEPALLKRMDTPLRGGRGFANPHWTFRPIVHFVRHPLAAVGSLVRKCGRRADASVSEREWSATAWAFVALNFPALPGADEPLRRAMFYWATWNRAAGEISTWTFRMERYSLAELVARLGHSVGGKHAAKARAIDAERGGCFYRAPSRALAWPALVRADARLAEQIRRQASEYGYDPDDVTVGCGNQSYEIRRPGDRARSIPAAPP